MSCGKKITSSRLSRHELADAVRDEAGTFVANRIERGECMNDYDLRRAQRALESADYSPYDDYRVERCYCD